MKNVSCSTEATIFARKIFIVFWMCESVSEKKTVKIKFCKKSNFQELQFVLSWQPLYHKKIYLANILILTVDSSNRCYNNG